ncbi:MAG: hypothetical protein ABIK28_24875 [Planctomycetota bacterium]
MAALLKEGLMFYEETVDLDPALMSENRQFLIQSMACDAGRYLTGMDWTLDGIYLTFMSALHDDGANRSAVQSPSRFHEAMLPYILPGMETRKTEIQGKDRIERLELVNGGKNNSAKPIVTFEAGSTESLRITNAFFNASEGSLTQKLLRLARIGGGRVAEAPESAVLFFKASVSILGDILMPGIENLIPLTIMGYGAVDGNRLTIRFVP